MCISIFELLYSMCVHHETLTTRKFPEEFPRCIYCDLLVDSPVLKVEKFTSKRRRELFEQDFWEMDFFRSSITGMIIISDRVRRILEKSNFTNYRILPHLDDGE